MASLHKTDMSVLLFQLVRVILKTGVKCKFGQKLTNLAISSFSVPLCPLHFVAMLLLVEFIDLVELHRTASDSDEFPDVSEF